MAALPAPAPIVPDAEAFAEFDRLLDLDRAEQGRRLARLRTARPELHAQVLALLEADAGAEAGCFLQQPLAPPQESNLGPGQQLGPYLLEQPLGSGGMGEVWRARGADGAPVALKLLHPHLIGCPVRGRFRREGRVLERLQHPNVARLLEAGVLPCGRPYLALEYVDGQRIDHWCDQRRLGLRARVELLLQVCEAVSHAHGQAVVHRDLKPSNVLVTADGTVKLLDFGIAKLLDEAAAADEAPTLLGERLLTPEYAAPEQIEGGVVNEASDVYALGVILYLLLCGRRPYGALGETARQIERKALHTIPLPPSRASAALILRFGDSAAVAAQRSTTPRRLALSLRGRLDAICGQALRKAAAERYPTVAALREDLCRYLEGRPVRAARAWNWRRRPGLPQLCAAAAFSLGMALLLASAGGRERVAAAGLQTLPLAPLLGAADAEPAPDEVLLLAVSAHGEPLGEACKASSSCR